MATELQGLGNSAAMPAPASAVATVAAASAKAPASAAPAAIEKPDLQFNPQQLRLRVEEAIDRLNEQMAANGRDVRFSIDNRLDRTVVTVRSSDSGEIVRQIPDESLLRVARSIEDLKGILYNEVI
jgi:flagellar protein FlaG